MTHCGAPTLTAEQIRNAIQRELSTGKRVVYVLLMLVTLTAAGLIAALWLTEPVPLPLRTQLVFSILLVINLSWAGFCGWVLVRRQVLFAAHRVIAGWMAVIFCFLFLGTGSAIAYQRASSAAFASIVLLGAIEAGVAIVVLQRALRYRRQLITRRDELMR
jgi:hypothetical protein